MRKTRSNTSIKISRLAFSKKLGCFVFRVKLPGTTGCVTCQLHHDEDIAHEEYKRQKEALISRYRGYQIVDKAC